jgi:hypothetical protein
MNKDLNVVIELTAEQVVFIINNLGDLPSKTGSWIISQNLIQQLEKQIPKNEPENGENLETTLQ